MEVEISSNHVLSCHVVFTSVCIQYFEVHFISNY